MAVIKGINNNRRHSLTKIVIGVSFCALLSIVVGLSRAEHVVENITIASAKSDTGLFESSSSTVVTTTNKNHIRTNHRDHDDNSAGSSIPVMANLSVSNTFFPTVRTLYDKYGAEIKAFRPIMRKWCRQTHSCKFTDFEVEMMYMLIRETKPQKVFEMAPNRGFSSHWILHALHQNDDTSTLHSFDLHSASVKWMNKDYKDRWVFTLGDYEDLMAKGKLDDVMMDSFDFIFIDALHEEQFSRGYCKKLLHPRRNKKAIVAIHDIVADEYGGGRESSEVYRYMAFANNVRHAFTTSQFFMPTLLDRVEGAVEKLQSIRADHGIVKPCDEEDCNKALRDPLYFENNSAPTIFFQLN